MTWVDVDSEYLVTASEDGAVRLYKHGAASDSDTPASLVHIIRREVLPVRCVALESGARQGASPRAAVCSDELIVRVVNAADPRSIQLLTGHTRGVRAASWSPVWSLLLTSGADGDIRAWDLSGNEPQCVKILSNLLPALRPESEFLSQVAWHPSGAVFAVPLKTQEIALVRAPTSPSDVQAEHIWDTVAVLGASSGTVSSEQRLPKGLLSAMAFCPNGRYLAAATEDSQVTVWALDSRRVIRTEQAEGLVTGLSWHPTKDMLAWTDMQGQLVRWSSVVGTTLPSPFEELEFASAPNPEAEREEFDEDEELDDLFDDTALADTAVTRPTRAPRGAAEPLRPRQPVIQPGSTPMDSSRRYLHVSIYGTLSAVDQDTHQTISFESYDTSKRHNFRFTDHYGYNMASTAAQGILFACEAESGSPSSVFFRPFDDLPGIQTEWSVQLPPQENAVVVALGGVVNAGSYADVYQDDTGVLDESRTSGATAVVGTSQGCVRFFGMSGMQRYVWALGQPIVTLAASLTSVLVVCRAGHDSEHLHLQYTLMELSSWTILQQGTVPLAPHTTLTWAGFNELGAPAVTDSHGTLYVLDRAWRPSQGRWVPSLDTAQALLPARQEGDETRAPRLRAWPIGVTATHLLGLLLPISQAYPPAHGPRPMVQEWALRLCLAQPESTATPLEEAALRYALLAHATRDARAATGDLALGASNLAPEQRSPGAVEMEADKALLQLIQLSCKADRYARALDGTRDLHSEATLDAALKIASFFHLPSLADRLELVRAPMAVRAERVDEMAERGCGAESLLRNTARVAAPMPPPAAAIDTPTQDFLPRATSLGHARSALAQEGLAQKQAPASTPSTVPSSTNEPTPSWEEPLPTPAAPPKMNPFARTHSVAKERQLQKSQSFFDRVDAPPKRKADDEPQEKRTPSARQTSLSHFTYSPPDPESETEGTN